MGVNDLSPIQISAIQCRNNHLSGGNVRGNGDIVQVTHAKKLLLGGIVLCRRASIAEIQKNINLIVRDS